MQYPSKANQKDPAINLNPPTKHNAKQSLRDNKKDMNLITKASSTQTELKFGLSFKYLTYERNTETTKLKSSGIEMSAAHNAMNRQKHAYYTERYYQARHLPTPNFKAKVTLSSIPQHRNQ